MTDRGGVGWRAAVVTADGAQRPAIIRLARETPLGILLNGRVWRTVYRTPGHDFELALGLLIEGGYVSSADMVQEIRYCGPEREHGGDFNTVDVALDIGDEKVVIPRPPAGTVMMSAAGVTGLLTKLDGATTAMKRGGVHTATVIDGFDATIICMRSDIICEQAIAKVLGWAATSRRLPLADEMLVVTGDINAVAAATAAVGGLPMLLATGIPTELAAVIAEEAGMMLVGDLSAEGFTVYCGALALRD